MNGSGEAASEPSRARMAATRPRRPSPEPVASCHHREPASPRRHAPAGHARRDPGADRFVEFLRQQIDIDLEALRDLREQAEASTDERRVRTLYRGFREYELKARLLRMHEHCGTGGGHCDRTGDNYPPEDERGCVTRALLGLPYADRPGYRARWRP